MAFKGLIYGLLFEAIALVVIIVLAGLVLIATGVIKL